jgi:hypothetical protein
MSPAARNVQIQLGRMEALPSPAAGPVSAPRRVALSNLSSLPGVELSRV